MRLRSAILLLAASLPATASSTYLRALYEMDTMMLPHTQRGLFSSRMVRERGELAEGE